MSAATPEQSACDDPRPPFWVRFLCPRTDRRFFLRLAAVAAVAHVFFGHVCIPAVARGESMVPTYRNGAYLLCWCPSYWFGKPQRGDVVMVRLAGRRVMFLKRVVALTGQTVAFRDGVLHVDGEALEEPYVQTPCNWNLGQRDVPPGHVYVVGDNRGMPMEQHHFGKAAVRRVVGRALW